MMLYELKAEYQQLYDALDGLDLEAEEAQEQIAAYMDTLEGLSGEFDEMAGNLGAMVKQLLSDAEQLDKEKKSLGRRSAQKKAKAQRLKEYLVYCMDGVGKTKVETPQAVVSIRKNAPSVQVDDEALFMRWAEQYRDDLLRYLEPEIDKTALKKELQIGMKVPGVSLVQTTSAIIR